MRTRSVIVAAIIVAGAFCAGCAPYPYERFTPRVAPALGELRDDHALIHVYYATDRAPTGDDDPYLYYGAERRDDLHYGVAVVSIPADHGRGRLEQPLFGAARRAARDVALLRVDPMDDRAALEQRLKAALDQSPQRCVLVYVHGFNTLMGDSARRGAQIAHDIEFAGPVVLYSWPTQGWLLSYLVDASNVEWTAPHLAEFLRMLRAQEGVERIHLLAHSMGCRVLCRAVERLSNAAADEEPMFDQIVLAAADVDAQLFERDYLPALSHAARRVTAYVSRADWALGSSRWLHKYPRLGLDGPPEIPTRTPAPFDVIDATRVDKGPVGHYYFGNSPDVLRDLAGVLAGRSPAERGLVGEGGLFRIEPRGRVLADK
ncbi:MAG: alpha/beta hydrolase [Planctomycetota bacterium]|nr:MAG: alpha/beta hydrolase [Planctomycetota bacterium]